MDLSTELDNVGGGVQLFDTFVTHLAFADDLVVFSSSESGLTKLLRAMENWCVVNRMKVSIEKSQVISSTCDGVWPVLNLEFEQKYSLKVVEMYKYLGLHISPKLNTTSLSLIHI